MGLINVSICLIDIDSEDLQNNKIDQPSSWNLFSCNQIMTFYLAFLFWIDQKLQQAPKVCTGAPGGSGVKGKWQPTPVFLPGKSHGQRRLVGYSPLGSKRVRHDLATKQQQYQYKNAYSEQSTVFSGTSMLVYCSDSVGQCNCKCFTRGIFSALSSDLYYTHTTCTHTCIYIFSFQILAQAWTQQWSERKMCCSC